MTGAAVLRWNREYFKEHTYVRHAVESSHDYYSDC